MAPPVDATGPELLTHCRGLRTCLEAVPHFAFSNTGRANLCHRFRLNDAQLTAALVAYGDEQPPAFLSPTSDRA